MKWGGTVSSDTGQQVTLINTCTIDNLLWICYCWFTLHPETLNYITHSDVVAVNNLRSTVELLPSGCYDDSKSVFLNEDKFKKLKSSRKYTIDLFENDKLFSYIPLNDTLHRTASSVICTSQYCPGGEIRLVKGADLHLPEKISTEDNLITTAIALWESGGDRRSCDALFEERPRTHDNYLAVE